MTRVIIKYKQAATPFAKGNKSAICIGCGIVVKYTELHTIQFENEPRIIQSYHKERYCLECLILLRDGINQHLVENELV